MIPYGRQHIIAEDIQSVAEVLDSDWLTQGPVVTRFEREIAAYCGAKYAVAVNSATSALHLACLAAGLDQSGKLWTSPNTFVASANCALYCGASPDFVDIDPFTYNLSISCLERKLETAKLQGTLPTVVVPVHFAGQSCCMETIAELAKYYGFSVIEDASHAIGGSYQGSKIGGCTFSDMTVFSFHPVKIITTGEGGMVLTNQKDLYERLMRLRSHGITREPALMDGESHGPWYYQQIELGFNYRLTDIQAALGLSQFNRLEQFIERRRYLAARYQQALADLPIQLPMEPANTISAFHLYVVCLAAKETGKRRREVFEALRAAGIGVNVHYIPVHMQPYYQRIGFRAGDFPQAEAYYERAITLPLYFGLTEAEQDYIVAQLREVIQ